MKNRSFACWFFVFLISPLPSIHEELRPEAPANATNVDSILNTKVPEFNLNEETIEVGLKRLASGSAAFAMGFEHELKSKQMDPPILGPRLTLHLRTTTVREALDSMCRADSTYTWSTDDTLINVYPIKTVNDASYLLNRRLMRLDLKELTDIQQGLLAIVNQLPPPKEQVAVAQIGGDDSYPPEPWTASYEELTVRQAINRLVRHMGKRGSWAWLRRFPRFCLQQSEVPCQNPLEQKTADGGDITVEWQRKSQAFMEIVTLKRFSVELDRENVKDFDLLGR
jgi:hypothetical protein